MPYAVVVPYSTWESLASFVVHVIVAPPVVLTGTATAEIAGGVVSVTSRLTSLENALSPPEL